MERVAFLLPDGERITCMLNPEHIVQRRVAGLAPRRTGAGVVAGPARSDSPLLHTGGGRTELELQLLFDLDLLPPPIVPPPAPVQTEPVAAEPVAAEPSGSDVGTLQPGDVEIAEPGTETPLPIESGTDIPLSTAVVPPRRDVRDHTRPLWQLAENSDKGGRGVPEVRVVYGKEMNVLAVVESLAERFERFDASGTPSRSWLSMRLVRVPDPNPPAPETPVPVTIPDAEAAAIAAAAPAAIHVVIGAGSSSDEGPAAGGETLPEIAARYFGGRSALWRWIADVNVLDDVIWPEAGRDLIIPPAPEDLPTGATR
ncbi:hypothetical protein [Microbacterium pumilum]|uniref:LysM domain-containing protein n=1 Tax=Microbacterium pumilum TaxID=344165 RepID=A0ABN2RU42_9MICO